MKVKKFANGKWVDGVRDDKKIEAMPIMFAQDKELDELVSYATVFMFALDNIYGGYLRMRGNDECLKVAMIPIPEICLISEFLGVVVARIAELSNRRLRVCWCKTKQGDMLAGAISITDNNGIVPTRICAIPDIWEKLMDFKNEADNKLAPKTWTSVIWFMIDNHGQEICDMVYEALDWERSKTKFSDAIENESSSVCAALKGLMKELENSVNSVGNIEFTPCDVHRIIDNLKCAERSLAKMAD